jgi:hypothetical protein
MRKTIDLAAMGVPKMPHILAEEVPMHSSAVFDRLLTPLDPQLSTVRFRHDRIQEVAQAELAGDARLALHLLIGQALLPTLTSAEQSQDEADGRPGGRPA